MNLGDLKTGIRRIWCCLWKRAGRLCSIQDIDPVEGRPENIRVLYWGYTSRAIRIRRAAYLFMLLTFSIYVAIFFGIGIFVNVYVFGEKAMKDLVDARDEARRTYQVSLPDFNDVARSSHDTKVVVAVGNDGTIFVSADNGKNWKSIASGTGNDLYSVAFSTDGESVIAVGADGTVLTSTDSGRSWNAGKSGTRKDLNEVVLNEDGATAIVAGDDGRLLASSDSGETWNELNDVTPDAVDLNGLALGRSGGVAVAVGDDRTIMVSHDNGGSWKPRIIDGINPKADFNAVAFGSDDEGVFVGDDKTIIEFSRDGNDNNDMKFKPVETGDADGSRRTDFDAIAFSRNGETAIAVGGRRDRGLIWAYDGKKKTWCEGSSNVGDRLNAVALDGDGDRAVAVGRDGAVLISTDYGRQWHSRDVGTANELYAVTIDEEGKVAIAVGENGTILRSESSHGSGFMEFESVFPRLESVPEIEPGTSNVANSNTVTEAAFFYAQLIYRNLVIVGPVLVLIFAIRYLVILTRYTLRLSAFYDARGDAVLFALSPEEKTGSPQPPPVEQGSSQCEEEQADPPRLPEADSDLPRPTNVGELEQLMRAVSPDDLDFGRTPKTTIEQVARLAKVIVGRREET